MNEQEKSTHLWFLNTLVKVCNSWSTGNDGISMLEHRAPFHDSPPMHIHHTEDEVFHILDGAFIFKMKHEERKLTAGDTLLMPKGVPHSYLVDSPEGGHWITVTTKGDFEKLVLAISRPALQIQLSEPSGIPSAEDQKFLSQKAAEFNIEIVGPPLH
jgi:mannose-6-phosphate isomerase-like protein (cupin superfamily)